MAVYAAPWRAERLLYFKQSADAVATSREGHRLPRSAQALQHPRWDRGRQPFLQIEFALRPPIQLYL
jgi:hypothetical protein